MPETFNVHDFLALHIARSGRPLAEIAGELGHRSPALLTAMLDPDKGIKLPLVEVEHYARVLGCDAFDLLDVAMSAYMPDVWPAILRLGHQRITRSRVEVQS